MNGLELTRLVYSECGSTSCAFFSAPVSSVRVCNWRLAMLSTRPTSCKRTITGTDIYQVEGYENDIVIRSPRFLRLWDLAKGKYRWEREGAGGQICGFTRKYILLKVGYFWLRERKTGHLYGEFRLPIYTAFTSLKEEHHFGPVMSARGLFLYKPGRKAIFIFQIDDEKVDARIWESTVDIQGRLLLRGGLDNLELELNRAETDLGQIRRNMANLQRNELYQKANSIGRNQTPENDTREDGPESLLTRG